MLFRYTVLTSSGKPEQGEIDAVNQEVAIASLQRRGYIVSAISEAGTGGFLDKRITLFERVSTRDIVLLSRQMSTLFEAQVSALRIFRLLAAESENPLLAKTLTEVGDDLQAGSAISKALAKHPNVFSDFYVNMVRAGEEAGKLDQTLLFLADHLDSSYALSTKARNALIYPAFVVFTFVAVMILMLTLVIPKISVIILESGQDIPFYTKIVIGLSNFFISYGVLFLILLVVGAFFLWRFSQSEKGKLSLSSFKLSVPYVGDLYRRLYLSRIADNLQAMLASGIPMVRALEISSAVVGNHVYQGILVRAIEEVKGGSLVSASLSKYPEIPSIMVQMLRIGEETGELASILDKLAKFYQREVTSAVETLIDLIEPVMIVALGVGVGVLLASVLIPIYQVAGTI